MDETFRFHPAVMTAIRYFANPACSMQDLAVEFGISRQAIAKRIDQAEVFFATFGQPVAEDPRVQQQKNENDRLNGIVATLRRQIIVTKTLLYLANCLKERIAAYFPRFRLTRLAPLEKHYLLIMCDKFMKAGGLLKDFCRDIGKSSETIARWQKAYEQFGLAGLADKKTTPHHFSNKIPAWLIEQLLILFLRFPHWNPWQYHKYIKNNPAIQWNISVEAIKKIQATHRKRSDEEKARIKKRWCFAPGSAVWTVDFTTILKTSRYRLQLLTVSDQRSRFLFESALFLETSTEQVMDHLEELFIKYGKPFIIKADNGPELRMTLRKDLETLCIHLLNSPPYYGQFDGAHERIHRELKGYISAFYEHLNITRLVGEIQSFTEDHNHRWTLDCLGKRTPSEVFYSDPDFVSTDVEVIKPYVKDGELRMKFTNRDGKPARISMPCLGNEESRG